MIPCIMIGDSIAYGVGQARPECETVAKVGISSGRYVASLLPPGRTSAGTAVISLGVNDGATADTLENLRTVRGRIQAARVVWLLPGLKEPVREMIRTVAAENGDRTLDTRPEVGRDHLHPTGAGYERIAAATIGQADGGQADGGQGYGGQGYGNQAEPAVEVAYAPDEPRRATTRHARRTLRHARTLHAQPHAKAGPRTARAPRTAARPVTAKAGCAAGRCQGRILRS